MKRNILTLTLIVLLFAALPAGTALASRYDRIIGAGDVVDGNITVFDDDLLIEEGAQVNGEVTVFGGHVDVEGIINGGLTVFDGDVTVAGVVVGDVVVFSGDLALTDTAEIEGGCFSLGGNIDDASDSITCTAYGSRLLENMPRPPVFSERELAPLAPELPGVPPVTVEQRAVSRVARFFVNLSEAVGRSLLLGVLALVVAAVFPQHLSRIGEAVRQKPAASGVVGFLTTIAAPSLLVLLAFVLIITCIGILLLPAVFLLGLVPLVALLLGWIAVGERFGAWLIARLSMTPRTQIVTAAFGTATLTLALGLLGLLPPFNFGDGFGAGLIAFILASVGLGAAVLTRLGTKPYPLTAPKQGKVEAVLETLPEDDDYF